MKHSPQRFLSKKEERSLDFQGKVLPTSEHQEEERFAGASLRNCLFSVACLWLYHGPPSVKEDSRLLHLGGDVAGGGRWKEEGQQCGLQPSEGPGRRGE